jgi:hypothetical protein
MLLGPRKRHQVSALGGPSFPGVFVEPSGSGRLQTSLRFSSLPFRQQCSQLRSLASVLYSSSVLVELRCLTSPYAYLGM